MVDAEKLALAKFKRNDDWQKVRRLHLRMNPECAVCGARKRSNNAHHIKPYHRFPELEMEPTNLITLCEGRVNHHLFIGHLMNYKKYNKSVVEDARYWRKRIEEGE